ncbi:uncharacterized protein LOC131176686 [Hevea brasiliensis]|uniref:uncharacterized protein LOC131176686 n=1 Tax=Hevea brasiliensis TaxID=3981 RepID=UPI0025D65579|nr:uncharacterized protein LOC131176686 [Hevea brasiliensis]
MSSNMQKDIVNACATETINIITRDLGDALFSILFDEARDVPAKEQMAIVIRYVDKNGHAVEHILGIVHVTDTSALSLKAAIDALFSKHSLSISRLRGQGYDGASNMRALVAVVKTDVSIALLFTLVSNMVNVVGVSCKCYDILQESQVIRVLEALENDLQLQELNNHSNEVNTELLLCVACLSQNDSFSAFDKEKLLRFTQFYPIEFSIVQLVALDNQLETYILDIKSNAKFSNLIGISNLAEKMVKTKRNVLYPLVYRLITLTLILLVAIASVERAFLI